MAATHVLLAPIAADQADVQSHPVLVREEARRQAAIEAQHDLLRQGAAWPEIHACIAELLETA
jgi:hypothetical protein